MRWNYRRKAGTFSPREDGVVAVEFVILFPLFMLILVGIVEFGHLFYVRHTLTNATREGARAAVVYFSSDRVNQATTAANTAINNYLGIDGGKSKVLPGVTLDLHPDVSVSEGTSGPSPLFSAGPPDPVSGVAPAAGTTGSHVTVSIIASNATLILEILLDQFIGWDNPITVPAETTMRME